MRKRRTVRRSTCISVKVFATPGDVEVASITVAVDPDQDQWELTIDFPLSADAATLYYLELALINETEGVQTVEWSARTTPVAVTPGVLPRGQAGRGRARACRQPRGHRHVADRSGNRAGG